MGVCWASPEIWPGRVRLSCAVLVLKYGAQEISAWPSPDMAMQGLLNVNQPVILNKISYYCRERLSIAYKIHWAFGQLKPNGKLS